MAKQDLKPVLKPLLEKVAIMFAGLAFDYAQGKISDEDAFKVAGEIIEKLLPPEGDDETASPSSSDSAPSPSGDSQSPTSGVAAGSKNS